MPCAVYSIGGIMAEPVIIGDCHLYLGDCLEVLPTLQHADHCLTDPPFEAEAHTLQRRINTGKTRGGDNDSLTCEQLPFAPIKNRNEVAAAISNITEGWALAFCQPKLFRHGVNHLNPPAQNINEQWYG